jgi:hypothetical protein
MDDVSRLLGDEEESPLDEARDVLGIDDNLDPLEALLAADAVEVTGRWKHKRTGATFTIRAIEDDRKFARLQERTTTERKGRGGRRQKDLDADRFNRLLCIEYTVSPSFAEGTESYRKLCAHYGVDVDSGAEALLRKVLLKGEIASLADAIMTISGFDDELVEVGKD